MEAVDTLLTSRHNIHLTLQCCLQKYQTLMKRMADNHRRDLTFDVGDWVYVKLCPYRQTSLQHTYSKLSKRFYGPFCILERIGAVAYRLQLPTTSKIHDVFLISLLKPHHGTDPTDSQALPPSSWDNHPVIHPLHILDWKLDDSVAPPIQFVLVQWHSSPPEDATWEHWSELQAAYDLKDKVGFQGEEIDSNIGTIPPGPGTIEPATCRPTRATNKLKYLEDYA